MASYFVKYNNVDLTNLIGVRTVETAVLPPRENNSITIWERPGGIYNSYRYGEREIIVTFLIRVSKSQYYNDPDIMNRKITDIGNVFKVTEPKPLYLGTDSRFIYAVPEGEFRLTEIRYDCYECEIRFICYDPQYYSSNVTTYSNKSSNARAITNNDSNTINVYNGGDSSTYPIINIGINNDNTSFVQIDNMTNGDKVLLGDYPTSDKASPIPTKELALDDSMDSTNNWSVISNNIDSDRSANGSLGVTSMSDGLMIGSVGSGSTTWKGVSAKKSLNAALTDFSVHVKMSLNSTGRNGDPTNIVLNTEPNVGFVEADVYYKVAAPVIEVRDTPNTSGRVIGTLKKGDTIYPYQMDYYFGETIQNGWVPVNTVSGFGYCYAKHLKKYYMQSGNSTVARNVYVTSVAELRATADINSQLLATIPVGVTLRINTTKENGFYKLQTAYKGIMGYIEASKVVGYEGVTVECSEEELAVTSDNKTGICEVYGWSNTGTKLFKLSLLDDNDYYECTKPIIQVGSNTILQDNTTSNPNKDYNESEQLTVTHDYLLDGAQENWNDFYGELGIQRKNGKWQAWIYKIKDGSTVKKLLFNEQAVIDSPEDKLAYITIYMGTKDSQNISGMSISDIKVYKLNNVNSNNQNIGRFNSGDKLQIDCYNNKVYLNNQLYFDMDIGSKFIELLSGNNTMKVTSDDSDIFATILFNERYL